MAAPQPTTALTMEAQLLQVATRLQLAEQAYNTANPETPVNNVTIANDVEAGQVTIAVTLPVTVSDLDGTLQASAIAYLP